MLLWSLLCFFTQQISCLKFQRSTVFYDSFLAELMQIELDNLQISNAESLPGLKSSLLQTQTTKNEMLNTMIFSGVVKSGWIAKILVATVENKVGEVRLQRMMTQLKKAGVRNITNVVVGVNSKDYKTEEEMVNGKSVFEMSEKEKSQWMNLDNGFGIVHTKSLNETLSNGALAALLIHRYMWQQVAREPAGTWIMILEDDARLLGNNIQKDIPVEGVDMVWLDNLHCKHFAKGFQRIRGEDQHKWAASAVAYALTPRAAKALLTYPLNHSPDHLLNYPVHDGLIKAFCPENPLFTHGYKHEGMIGEPGHMIAAQA